MFKERLILYNKVFGTNSERNEKKTPKTTIAKILLGNAKKKKTKKKMAAILSRFGFLY